MSNKPKNLTLDRKTRRAIQRVVSEYRDEDERMLPEMRVNATIRRELEYVREY